MAIKSGFKDINSAINLQAQHLWLNPGQMQEGFRFNPLVYLTLTRDTKLKWQTLI